MTHGTFNGYRHGCRCDECRQAKAEHAARYRKPKPKRRPRVSRRRREDVLPLMQKPNAQPVPGPQTGNLYGLAHGALSDRLVLPDAQQLANLVFEANGHLSDRDRAAVLDYSIAQIRAWRFEVWLDRHSEFDTKGRVRPAVEHSRKWLQRAETARARLGLDPVSYASLNLDRAETARIAAKLAEKDLKEGRRLREARKLVEGRVST